MFSVRTRLYGSKPLTGRHAIGERVLLSEPTSAASDASRRKVNSFFHGQELKARPQTDLFLCAKDVYVS